MLQSQWRVCVGVCKRLSTERESKGVLVSNGRLMECLNSGKSRDGSRDVSLGDEGHNSNHGKTSVVEFTVLLPLQGLRGNIGEVNWWEDHAWKWASLGVVDRLGLGDELSNKAGGQDLGLSGIRDGSPCVNRSHGGKVSECNVVGEVSREVKSGGVDQVANCGDHGSTSVLQFTSTEPSESLVGSNGGKAQRIEQLDGGGGSWQISKCIEGSAGLSEEKTTQGRRGQIM